jgi:hypothetical protein
VELRRFQQIVRLSVVWKVATFVAVAIALAWISGGHA